MHRIASSRQTRRIGCLTFAMAAIAGCNGYELTIDLNYPPAIAKQVASTRIEVYNRADPLTCDGIAMGEFSNAELVVKEPITVFGVGSDTEIDGIDRIGTKLVVGSGFDSEGRYVAAACETVGDIPSEGVTIGLTFELATRLDVTLPSEGSGASILLTVTDRAGTLMPGTVVRTHLRGAGAVSSSVDLATDAAGVILLDPDQEFALDLYGPYELTPHSRWMFSQPRAIPIMIGPVPLQPIIPPVGSTPRMIRSITLGHFVAPDRVSMLAAIIACTDLSSCSPPVELPRLMLIDYDTSKNEFTPQVLRQADAPLNTEALAVLPSANGFDSAVFLTRNPLPGCVGANLCLNHFTPSTNTLTSHDTGVSLGPLTVDAIFAMPACAGVDAQVGFTDHNTGNWHLFAFDGSGAPVVTDPGVTTIGASLLGAACAANRDDPADRYPILIHGVFDLSADLSATDMRNPSRSTIWPANGYFAKTSDQHMVALVGRLDGVHAQIFAPNTLDNVFDLELIAELDPWLGELREVASGDVDGDGRMDIVALVDFGAIVGSMTVTVFIVLDALSDNPVVSLTTGFGLPEAALVVGDLNGDGFSDIVVYAHFTPSVMPMVVLMMGERTP